MAELETASASDLREQQRALGRVLQAVARGEGLQPVLDELVAEASRLCGGEYGELHLVEGDVLRAFSFYVAGDLDSPIVRSAAEQWEIGRSQPHVRDRSTLAGRIALTEDVVLMPDMLADPDYTYPLPAGTRAGLGVPIVLDGDLIGTLGIVRDVRSPFTGDDVELVRTFADQAAVAVKNARLLDALQRQLDRQRAIGEILRAITRAEGLQSVLDEIVQTVTVLCSGDNVRMWLLRDGLLHAVANGGWADGWEHDKAHPHTIDRASISGRAAVTKQPVHVPDVTKDPEYAYDGPVSFRANLSVPILLDDELIGVFGIVRREPEPFSQDVIDLVQTFADQAAVAIANAKLLDAVERRLEQQEAVADVLHVVARSEGLPAVFTAVVEAARRLGGGISAQLYLLDGDVLRVAAHADNEFPPAYEYAEQHPHPLDRSTVAGRVAVEGDVVQIPDVSADSEYAYELPGHIRSLLGVPIAGEGELIGAIAIAGGSPVAFSEESIRLVKTFADQAAIAIANARLIEAGERQLEQQRAVADILRSVARSEGLESVFNVVADSATRLCHGDYGALYLKEGDTLVVAAQRYGRPDTLAFERDHPHAIDRTTASGRAAVTRDVVHIPDTHEDPEYSWGAADIMEYRSLLAAPIMLEDELIGAMNVVKVEPDPFAPEHVDLIRTFADQAAIAIANARLVDAVRRQLDQQRAISEVLAVVARAEGLESVLHQVVEVACRLCDAQFGEVHMIDGDLLRLAVGHGGPPELYEYTREHPDPAVGSRDTINGRILLSKDVVHIPDILEDTEYSFPAADVAGVRGLLGAPLLVEGELVGVFNIVRTEPVPFTEEQIGLLRTFADQAAIAVANARLMEARERQLEQQRAISGVFGVVARSEGLDSVFAAVIEAATRLCGGEYGGLYILEDGLLHARSHFGMTEQFEYDTAHPHTPDRGSLVGRVGLTQEVVHIPNLVDDPEYDWPLLAGHQAGLAVPIVVEDEFVGVIGVTRKPEPFTPEQIDLVKTFADQAAIAIANARLIEAIERQLEQQRAMGEVLGAVARAEGLEPVLRTVVEAACRLCEAQSGAVHLIEGDVLRLAVGHGGSPKLYEYEREHPRPISGDRASVNGRVLVSRDVVHIPDIRADEEYTWPAAVEAGVRTVLGAPLLVEDQLVGVFNIVRTELLPFTDEQIELLRTFADQAAIAVANAGLMEAVERQRAELSRFVSPQVAELVSSDEGQRMLSGHRAYVTSMFFDLRGFTSFTELAEPEELFEVLREYHVGLGELIPRFEGTLEHFAGDGLMVFFNDPVPVDDHELKAIELALAAQERFDELAVSWRKRGHELGLGIGIAAGYATLGRIGFEGRYDYGVLGTVTNLASRLSSAAEPGQTLISQRVYAAVEETCEAVEVGALELKGFGRPVPAFEVRGLHA